jgi:hypothetical protein
MFKEPNLEFLFSKKPEDNVNVELRQDWKYNIYRRVVEVSKENVWSEYWETVGVYSTFVEATKESTKFNLRIERPD